MSTFSSLHALSPLDGRYHSKLAALRPHLSEWALMKYRLHVEVEWLVALSDWKHVPELRAFTDDERVFLRGLVSGFDDAAAETIKAWDRKLNHDVKSVEYYLRDRLGSTSLAEAVNFVHFACTSEDVNNLSYTLMVRDAVNDVWVPELRRLLDALVPLVAQTRELPMLARTHGQPAVGTTLGKELAVFVDRWRRQLDRLATVPHVGKFSGAVGNFNAHLSAYPDAPWREFARAFVSGLGLEHHTLTTQVEPRDHMAELLQGVVRANTIGVDFARDMWSYISLGYFRQAALAGEVGSSTMPHKVNPIFFENAEGNFGVSSALLTFLAGDLPVSRLQRDLHDSTVMRNLGVALGHSLLAVQALREGVARVAPDADRMAADIAGAWESLAEPIQTVLRKYGVTEPYERLKALTRGVAVDAEVIRRAVEQAELSDDDRARLAALTPDAYVGLAAELADEVLRDS